MSYDYAQQARADLGRDFDYYANKVRILAGLDVAVSQLPPDVQAAFALPYIFQSGLTFYATDGLGRLPWRKQMSVLRAWASALGVRTNSDSKGVFGKLTREPYNGDIVYRGASADRTFSFVMSASSLPTGCKLIAEQVTIPAHEVPETTETRYRTVCDDEEA